MIDSVGNWGSLSAADRSAAGFVVRTEDGTAAKRTGVCREGRATVVSTAAWSKSQAVYGAVDGAVPLLHRPARLPPVLSTRFLPASPAQKFPGSSLHETHGGDRQRGKMRVTQRNRHVCSCSYSPKGRRDGSQKDGALHGRQGDRREEGTDSKAQEVYGAADGAVDYTALHLMAT